MKKEIIMPKIGLDMEEGTIEQWLISRALSTEAEARLGRQSASNISALGGTR